MEKLIQSKCLNQVMKNHFHQLDVSDFDARKMKKKIVSGYGNTSQHQI